jgi:hypothetical protein
MNVIVPNHLSEINLGQYQHFLRLEGDEEFLAKKMIEIFCGLKMDLIHKMKVSSISKISKILSTMLQEKAEFKPTFKINDQEFGFIPILEDLTFGELHDLDQTISDWQRMNEAMCVLFRPIEQKIGKRYRIKEWDGKMDLAETMKQMPMDVVMGSVVFFCNLGIDLSAAFLRYLAKQEGITTIPLKDNSLNDGDGFPYSILSPEVMQQNLTKHPNSPHPSPSHF